MVFKFEQNSAYARQIITQWQGCQRHGVLDRLIVVIIADRVPENAFLVVAIERLALDCGTTENRLRKVLQRLAAEGVIWGVVGDVDASLRFPAKIYGVAYQASEAAK